MAFEVLERLVGAYAYVTQSKVSCAWENLQ